MGSASTKSITESPQTSSQADSLISSQLKLKVSCNQDRELRKRKRKPDESGRPYGDEVDMGDPLLITRVKARANRVRNSKKIQQTSITKENKRNKVQKELNVVNPEAKARRYQLEGVKKALEANSILYLETGAGKTLVAVLLIKSLARNLRSKDDKRIAVFLVPKVILVHQQAEVIAMHTDLKVEEYWGEKGVDTWTSKEWQTQISENEVLVMTPQIFLNNLQHGFFKMEMVELLIFDECHHAKKNHPYARIMLDFYHKDPKPNRVPKIFGMTASPLTKRGVKTSSEAANQLTDLEVMLDCKVFTFKDRGEVEAAAPTPSTREVYYIAPEIDTVVSHKDELEDLLNKFEEANKRALGNKKVEYKDQQEVIEKLEKRTAKLHRDLQYCLEELGVWCAYKAAEHWMKGDGVDSDLEAFVDIAHTLKYNKEAFLKAAIQTLQRSVPKGWAESCREVQELEEAVRRGYLTPKVQRLVTVLSEKRGGYDERCIVFVERIIAAVVLASLVNHIGCLQKFLSAEWMSGSKAGSEPAQHKYQKIMKAFQDGKVNILVATEVAEEGLDVKSCSSVIRFDLPKTVRSHIQSRGRARQPGSEFIIFLERGNEHQKALVSTVKVSEESMKEQALSRTLMQPNAKLPAQEIVDSYCVNRTGATVDTNNSVAWLSQFCSKFPGDIYYTPRPEYFIQKDGSSFTCTIKLPVNAPIYQVFGSPRASPKLAKTMAALEAIKKLHAIGALNDHLLPILDEDEEESMNLKNSTGAGTNKRKELHLSMVPLSLKGQWHISTTGACLHGYVLNFEVRPSEEKTYASFVLLIGAELDDDVAHLKTRLCLPRDREAVAELSPIGKLSLSLNQLKEAMLFQELLFNGLFSRLTKYIKVAKKLNRGTCGPSLPISSDNWSPNNMYLILPATSNTTKNTSNHAAIDWACIENTVLAVESLGQAEKTEKGSCRINSSQPILSTFGQSAVQAQERGTLHMARGRHMPVSQVVDSAVMTIHTGKIYAVVEVFGDKTAGSPFPEKQSGEKSEFSNYAEFFKIKHGQVLDYPDQPLLNLKQSHRIHNLLPLSRVIKGTAEKAKSAEAIPVEMPPELCLVLGISTAVVRSAYLIPSVMHRLKSALTASHLRRTIQEAIPSTPAIPIARVLESITTLRCNESFNMERLELLGDSFLKYAVSRSLFLYYDEKHEGQLSGRRMHQICNAKLHELALDRNLPVYIRDERFDPSCWVAPGMLSCKEVKCKCKFEQIGQPFQGTLSKAVFMSDNEVHTKEPGGENGAKVLEVVPKLGRSCDSGHRYLCSKTIADVMEALIGAYLIEASYAGALSFMAWAGFDVDCSPTLIKSSSERSTFDATQNLGIDISCLEQRIGYTFCNKILLVEAMTHASNMLNNLDGKAVCYQRLEFLGDAVLDCLISQHLFSAHADLSPGHLTTLRSAAVNNERFARVAVKHKLHCYLRHGSGLLMNQIHNFVKALEEASDEQKNSSFGLDGLQGPKVLGDLVESIAGAILVDTSFNLDKVWVVMRPLLSPIITPETLMQHPVVELHELCSRNGYSLALKTIFYGQEVIAKYEVKVGEEAAIVRSSRRLNKKTAQKDAAQKVLGELEIRGQRGSTNGRSKRSEAASVIATKCEAFASMNCRVGDVHRNEENLCVSITNTESDIITSRGSEFDGGVLVNVEASSDSKQFGESTQIHTDGLEVDHKSKQLVDPDQVTSKNLIEVSDSQVQQAVIEQGDVKMLLEVEPLAPLPQSPVDATSVSPQTPEERVELSHTPTVKRKLELDEEDSRAAEKRAKYYWSQEKSVNDLSTNETTVTEKVVSSEEPMDISTLCPWTGRYTSVNTVPEVQVEGTTCSSLVLCAVKTSTEVPAEGRIQCSSIVRHETSKKVQDVIALPLQPMMTTTVAHQRAVTYTGDTAPKKLTKDDPVNSRQALYQICTKYKWIHDFNLKSEEGMPHARRFTFSVKVDTKVEKFTCDGEKMATKKQAQESAASAMMSLIQHKGLIDT